MMDAALNSIPSWAAAGGGAGAGFFVLKFILEWIGGRVDKREEVNTASAARLDAATYKLIDTLEKRMEDLTARLDLVERELVGCRAQHAQCEAELTRLRAAVQGLGDARQQAANIIAADKAMDRTVALIIDKAGESGQ